MTPLDATPSVLLGTLEPILRVGIVRALLDAGATVVDGADTADELVERAASYSPNAVVLGTADGGVRGAELRARLQSVVPNATLVLWREDRKKIEVLRPGDSKPHVMSVPVPERLASALLGEADEEGGPCPAI